MKFLEKVFTVLALIGILMKLIHVSGGIAVTALAMMCLAVLYLLGGFLLFNDIRLRDCFKKSSYSDVTVSRVLLSLLASGILFVSIVSILFRLAYWEANIIILYTAAALNFVFTVIIAIVQSIKHNPFHRHILTRTAVLLIIMGCLAITPTRYLESEKQKVISMETRLLENSQ